ncbi:unknown protein [Seminavis robusta]|uniref:Uncharacterized protein n=1 Tax=Seminavis robusta TaxID=568900 RepID=A0A9N8HXG8_9STRA|nr:unknown protein [Seminavis robusta]|eukprot:Sro2209_g319180.1 n/a (235) ;mRNA; f:10761-11465
MAALRSFIAVASINNLAVSKVVEGRHEEAVEIFMGALSELKAAFAKDPETDPRSMDAATVNQSAAWSNRDLVQLGPSYPEWDGSFSFNNSLFLLPTEYMYPKDSVSLVTMVLLFNLGSIRHQLGLVVGSSLELQRAMKLYELALASLENIPACGDWNSMVWRMQCCLCNNMGHVFEQNGNFQQSSRCLEWLIDTLDGMHDWYSGEGDLDYDDLDFYYPYFGMPKERWFNSAPAA